jgi:hypothetical protein
MWWGTGTHFRALLGAFDGLEIIETTITNDVRVGHEDEKWLNTIIQKKK